jgi:uncharacterized protein (DUF2252 family)
MRSSCRLAREEVRYSLIDIKEAAASVVPTRARVPRDHAQRVIEGAKALAPALGERMVEETVLGWSVVIRELLPADLKIDAEVLTRKQAASIAGYLGRVVGHAHARQMIEKQREAWAKKITGRTFARGRLPMWLWTSVVELLGQHEKGYLEHCRLWPPLSRQKPVRGHVVRT